MISKKDIKETLLKLDFEKDSVGIDYFVDAIQYVKKNNISAFDVTLSSMILPLLEKKYHKSQTSISACMRRTLKSAYTQNGDKFKKLLLLGPRPTVLKMIMSSCLQMK